MRSTFSFSIALILCLQSILHAQEQGFKFAFLSDTHVTIGSPNNEDLQRSVEDINANHSLQFVIVTGDITEFGSDAEIKEAKRILGQLNKPTYIIPGNHDANWSESGANTFRKVFGGETVCFEVEGYLFVGTGSGPNMRMGPGQIPRENITWLDSVLSSPANKNKPIVFLNHYPQDSSLNNWYEVTDMLRKYDTRLILHGHGHTDKQFVYDGIPAVMGRSNLRARKDTGAYNIVSFIGDSAYFRDKTPGGNAEPFWAKVYIGNHHLQHDTVQYWRPDYSVNKKYGNVTSEWVFSNQSDIGSGPALHNKKIFITDTNGWLRAIDGQTGQELWKFATGGKVYSTPAVSAKGIVVFASTDQFIYGIDGNSGKLLWKLACDKPNVACPVIAGNKAYIGGSDGHFRCIDIETGSVVWDFDEVKGFVVTKPLFYNNTLYFGCWNNDFYALDAQTGKLTWKWNNGASNRMFSPAACWPVAANGRIFIVAPDRYMTVFDAATGKVIWREKNPAIRVRESMGLSADQSLVYAKTMEGLLLGFSPTADSMQIAWRNELRLPYEICPTAITEQDGIVFVPSNSGLVSAVLRDSGKILWQHKISNCMITGMLPAGKNRLLVTTMDGKLAMLQWE